MAKMLGKIAGRGAGRATGKTGAWSVGNGEMFLLCFLAGILGGTIAGNMGLLVKDLPASSAAGSKERFFYICRQRAGEGAAGWLFGLTVCAAPCFWLLAGYLGFSMAWIITCYTASLGVLGLPGFLLSCFPQWLFYVPAWYLLIWWGLNGPVRLRLLPAMLVLALLCLGAGAETFIHPLVMGLLV
ncbi:MAG: hypothetical protein Q4C66_12550 [Lachnospiraceae bacterium]|nr:hypothetical protein [Lachnospiraceae bacterium]